MQSFAPPRSHQVSRGYGEDTQQLERGKRCMPNMAGSENLHTILQRNRDRTHVLPGILIFRINPGSCSALHPANGFSRQIVNGF